MKYHPDQIAIEAPFYGKNVQSMLKLGGTGGSDGWFVSRNSHYGILSQENKNGYYWKGNASKNQVAKMLQNLF